MSIQGLDCNPKYINLLLSSQINDVSKVLLLSPIELQKKTGLKISQAEEVLKAASLHVLKSCSFSSTWKILSKKCETECFQFEKLATGCNEIDRILGGGILTPGITEVAGESSSGKTQLCLQICVDCRIKFPSKKCLYISTEDAFPNKRLQQLSSLRYEGKANDVTNGIFIEHAADLDMLISFLESRLTSLLQKEEIKIIVIDSIAAVFRVEFESWELSTRAKLLSTVGNLLQKISFKYNICILCVNQVSAVIHPTSKSNDVKPALGLTWSYFIKTRLQLARTKHTLSMCNGHERIITAKEDSNIRTCSIIFSPHRPNEKCYFVVLENGICDFVFPS